MILDIIEKLASDNSRKFKEAVLEEHKNNELLKQVFVATLCPMTQYYIRKIPKYEQVTAPEEVAYSLSMALGLLKDLTQRKVTGHDAIAFLKNILESTNPKDAKVIELIIGKDLKCGVSDSTVNKIWKGLIQETPYMRCSLLKDMKNVDWEKGVISQVKADGSFVYFNHNEDGTIELFTRNGRYYDTGNLDFYSITSLKDRCIPRGHQLHGELLIEEDGQILNRQTGNGILNSLLKGGSLGIGQKVVMDAWDIIPIENFVPGGSYKIPYHARFKLLSSLLAGVDNIRTIESKIVYSLEEALDDYQDKVSKGLEGTILKDPLAIWEDKTSKRMWKFKVEFDCDLLIVDFKPGNGKNEKTFGSIKTVTSDDLLEVNVSGFEDDVREEIWKNKDNVIGKVITVKSNAILKPKKENSKHSLFLPRFVEIREDKTEADTLERVNEQYLSAIMLKNTVDSKNKK